MQECELRSVNDVDPTDSQKQNFPHLFENIFLILWAPRMIYGKCVLPFASLNTTIISLIITMATRQCVGMLLGQKKSRLIHAHTYDLTDATLNPINRLVGFSDNPSTLPFYYGAPADEMWWRPDGSESCRLQGGLWPKDSPNISTL